MLLKLGANVKNSTLLQDCGESINYSIDLVELELETQEVVDESIACNYGEQFICPNCGETFDGHECENCKYTEEK